MMAHFLNIVNSNVFDQWAEVYDRQNNPLLALEERYLAQFLPPFEGKHVLDVGCGTGRWLSKIAEYSPASLVGMDASPAMLERARDRQISDVCLLQGDCTEVPVKDASTDVILSSFVLSYISDVHLFAQECERVLKPGGVVIVSDMHPETAEARRWKRGFECDGAWIETLWCKHSLTEVAATFQSNGFWVQSLLQPSFGEAERSIFERSQQTSRFDNLSGFPAVYLFRFYKPYADQQVARAGIYLANAKVATSPTAVVEKPIVIQDGRIHFPDVEIANDSMPILDLSGCLILPGLINAHDHLEFGLFPNLGRDRDEPPYRNSQEWANEIHIRHSVTIARHLQVPKSTRLWWGAIRNLLSGVTTVCHHNPWDPEFTKQEFPVRVISQLNWAHSLAFDEPVDKFKSGADDVPFVIHAAEGTDERSAAEVNELDLIKVLERRTVLVHGLAISEEDISLLNRRGSALVVCPTSNLFLFHKSPSNILLSSVERIAIGSDSPLTAAGNLLDEIHYASEIIGIPNVCLYRMVTTYPAQILQLQDEEGILSETGIADLIVVRTNRDTPASALMELTLDRIEMVLIGGEVRMASPAFYDRLPQAFREAMQLLEIDGLLRWLRAPLDVLCSSAEDVLGKGNLKLGGRLVRHITAL